MEQGIFVTIDGTCYHSGGTVYSKSNGTSIAFRFLCEVFGGSFSESVPYLKYRSNELNLTMLG